MVCDDGESSAGASQRFPYLRLSVGTLVADIFILGLLLAPTGPGFNVGLHGTAIAVGAALICTFCSVMQPLQITWRKAVLVACTAVTVYFAVAAVVDRIA